MPELRQNVATHEWVIIATERACRPVDFVDGGHPLTADRPARVDSCPFCPGNEQLSAPPVLVVEEDGRWVLRVVENRYPALSRTLPLERHFQGVERSMSGFGAHEVLIESPRHNATPALQTDVEVLRTLRAFRERALALSADPRMVHVVFFKNHGGSAGASLDHPHAQLISMPMVSHQVRQRLQDATAYYEERGSCVFCDMWQREVELGARVVVDGRNAVSFVPYAACSPFHTWVVPKRHMALLTQAGDAELADFARVLRETLLRMYRGLHDPDYNYVVRTAPAHEAFSRSFHWYLSIVPRVGRTAGFELGSGMYINTALPEESAAFLRGVDG